MGWDLDALDFMRSEGATDLDRERDQASVYLECLSSERIG